MRIAVGSGNPVKRAATVRVCPEATVTAEPVPSGVAEQPTGHAETRAGAENRAAACLDAGSYDLGVGIEGGVARFDDGSAQFENGTAPFEDGTAQFGTDAVSGAGEVEGLCLVMWAAVTDGERWGRGTGPSLPLPDRIARRVAAGEELGPVMDDALGAEDVAKKEGAAGAFTAGRLTRTDALETAVAAASAPFVSELY